MRLLGAARSIDESDTRSATVALVGAGCSRPVLTLFIYDECLERTSLLRIHTITMIARSLNCYPKQQISSGLDRAMEPDYGKHIGGAFPRFSRGRTITSVCVSATYVPFVSFLAFEIHWGSIASIHR